MIRTIAANTGSASPIRLGSHPTFGSRIFINDTFQQPGYFLYVQDDFKVSKRLTLNLGLRYEFISMPKERRDAEASYNIATGALDIPTGRNDPLPPNFFPQIAVNRNAPRQLVPQDRNNFGPRVGFAYPDRTEDRDPIRLRDLLLLYEAGPSEHSESRQ